MFVYLCLHCRCEARYRARHRFSLFTRESIQTRRRATPIALPYQDRRNEDKSIDYTFIDAQSSFRTAKIPHPASLCTCPCTELLAFCFCCDNVDGLLLRIPRTVRCTSSVVDEPQFMLYEYTLILFLLPDLQSFCLHCSFFPSTKSFIPDCTY